MKEAILSARTSQFYPRLLKFTLVSKKNEKSAEAKLAPKKQKRIAKPKLSVKTEKLAMAKNRIRQAKSLKGREIVLKIGTMSVLV